MGHPATGVAAVRISRWTILWLGIVAVLVAVESLILTGFITPASLISSFLTLIYALVVISVLAFIGAIFLGMFVSHRILSGKGFTPFEQEMLRMRQDLRELSDRVEQLATRLGVPLGERKKEP
jgi:pilus assembly protein TadC